MKSMVEFTHREKAIIHLMNILMNPQTKQIPLQLRVQSLAMICSVKGIPYNEDTMMDMSHGIEEETNSSVKEAFGLLAKHPEIMEHVKNIDLSKL